MSPEQSSPLSACAVSGRVGAGTVWWARRSPREQRRSGAAPAATARGPRAKEGGGKGPPGFGFWLLQED